MTIQEARPKILGKSPIYSRESFAKNECILPILFSKEL